MASGTRKWYTDVKPEVKDILTCSICFEILRYPKTLRCDHNFCKQCLADFLKAKIVKDGEVDPMMAAIACPICKQLFTDFKSLDSFKTNLTIRQLMDIYTTEASCDVSTEYDACCSQNPACSSRANLICIQCSQSFCDKCFTGDPMLICPEARPNNSLQHEVFEKADEDGYICHVHKLSVDFFCSACQKLICLECYLLSHKEHATRTVQNLKKQVSSRISTCKSLADENVAQWANLNDYASSIAKTIDEKSNETINLLKKQQKLALGFLCLSFDRIHGVVKSYFNARKHEMLQEIEKASNGRGDHSQLLNAMDLSNSHELRLIASAPEIERNIQFFYEESKRIQDNLNSLMSKRASMTKSILKTDDRKMLKSISGVFNGIQIDSVAIRPLEIPTAASQYEWLRDYWQKSMMDLLTGCPDYDASSTSLESISQNLKQVSTKDYHSVSLPVKSDNATQLPWIYTTDSSDDDEAAKEDCKAIVRRKSFRITYSRDDLLQFCKWDQKPKGLPNDLDIVLDKPHFIKEKRLMYSTDELLRFRFWSEKPAGLPSSFPVLDS